MAPSFLPHYTDYKCAPTHAHITQHWSRRRLDACDSHLPCAAQPADCEVFFSLRSIELLVPSDAARVLITVIPHYICERLASCIPLSVFSSLILNFSALIYSCVVYMRFLLLSPLHPMVFNSSLDRSGMLHRAVDRSSSICSRARYTLNVFFFSYYHHFLLSSQSSKNLSF